MPLGYDAIRDYDRYQFAISFTDCVTQYRYRRLREATSSVEERLAISIEIATPIANSS